MVSELRKLFDKYGCKGEPISVIAHSQGTIITLGALANGAKLNNFVALGSPLDAEHGVIDVSNAGPNVDQIYNYWSSHDGWASLKGGGQAWEPSYSTGGWIRDKKTWTLPNNVTQIDVSSDVGSHTAFQNEPLARQHYGANTGTAPRCCDRNNPSFKKEYDAIIKSRLQRP